MFARWHNVRLRSAEKALVQGRVDDALAVILELLGVDATPPGERPAAAPMAAALARLAGDARAQRVLDELAAALTARARVQRNGGRFREALGDLGWIAALGRATAELDALRRQIEGEFQSRAAEEAARQRAAGQRQAEAAQVADELRAGRLDSARLKVPQIDDPQAREKLAEDLALREQRGAQLLAQAHEALNAGDALLAVRLWQDACQRHGETRETTRFAARLGEAFRREVESWHQQGRIDALLAAQGGVERLTAFDPTLGDCRRLIELCGRAVAQLNAGQHAALRSTLVRLKAGRSEARWVDTALDALGRLAAAHEELLASPLGWQASDVGGPGGGAAAARTFQAASRNEGRLSPSSAAPAPDDDPQALRVDAPLLLLVDSGGSSLLLARDQVRLGRAGASSASADVPLPGECEAHHADVIRRDEDYFLVAYAPCRVNGRPAAHVLLRDGDRIELGAGPRFTFHRPSAKSRSAVLRLSHRSRLADDVSDVVLLADTCVIGAGPHAHVRLREALGPAVLFEARGVLHARQTGGDGHLLAPPCVVRSGQTLDLGGLRLTLKPYAAGRATG